MCVNSPAHLSFPPSSIGEEPGPEGVQRAAPSRLLPLRKRGASAGAGRGGAAPQQGRGHCRVQQQAGGPGGPRRLPGGTLCPHQDPRAGRGRAI